MSDFLADEAKQAIDGLNVHTIRYGSDPLKVEHVDVGSGFDFLAPGDRVITIRGTPKKPKTKGEQIVEKDFVYSVKKSQNSPSTLHTFGDSSGYLLTHYHDAPSLPVKLNARVAQLIDAALAEQAKEHEADKKKAVQEEREACYRIARSRIFDPGRWCLTSPAKNGTAIDIAEGIRQRSYQQPSAPPAPPPADR